MTVLVLGPKTSSPNRSVPVSKPVVKQDSVGEDALKVAAAALSAAKDAANMVALAGRGKIECLNGTLESISSLDRNCKAITSSKEDWTRHFSIGLLKKNARSKCLLQNHQLLR
ncbi:hypothetical protein QVD17_20144 [Tagetes erecta]|uniref:Uncharacterized protein n=1 Tax=Tagetes erecta TaxID=13708 RepID=A0AAD8KKR8_TARER|nr:hypothetical protein QVD17_20143 [Tagetes erecta]KAK1424806.1 hypothetical protein QVD17_20144 [Tagetes erecta]